MISRHRERGEGRVGFIITLCIFCVGVWLGVKILPVKINGYQFREKLREEARYGQTVRDDRELAKRILRTAESLNIPLNPKNVKIQRTQSEIVIKATYEQPIDLKLTTYTYKFDTVQRSPIF